MPELMSSKMPKNNGRPFGSRKEKTEADYAWRESRNELYAGVTLTDLTVMFRIDRRTILSKISDKVKPCGRRGKALIYQLRDVVPYIVVPMGSIEDAIKRMRPNDLPPVLLKEYWNGQRAKQKFLEDEGQLWRTDKVVETISSIFKIVAMNLKLVPDALERRVQLTDAQREEIRETTDGILNGLREALITQYGNDFSVEPGTQEEHEDDDDGLLTYEAGAETEDDEYDDTFDVPADGFGDGEAEAFEDDEL